MYLSGAVVAFFMVFFMSIGNERARVRRLEQGKPAVSGVTNSLISAVIGATLSWLMVIVCIVMFFVKKPQV